VDQTFDAARFVADAEVSVLDASLAGPMDAASPDATAPPDAHVCPDDYTANSANGHAYRFRRSRESWDDAVEECEDEGEGIHLVTIEDESELALVHALVNNTIVWVGASDTAVEGVFMLVTGELATFLPWAIGEPNNSGNEDCVELLAGTRFNDQGCDTEHAYVCECE
jgi:Lectin C-type domain